MSPSAPADPPSVPADDRSPLIGARELARRRESDGALVLLDVRWTLAGADRAAYRAGHLPGAVFVDLDAELAAPPGAGGRHPLPDPAVLAALLRRAGVRPGGAVVVYGERDASAAARAWWLLRWAGLVDVTVLDGGFRAWAAAGLPVVAGEEAEPGGGTVTVHPGGMPTVDADGAAALAAGRGSVLLDARAAERYRGEIEPVDPVAGHIPGAVNLPLSDLQEADGRFRDPATIAATLDAAGLRPGTPGAASCGSGVTACAVILAGELVGRQLALYPGSYSGWCASGRRVETP